MSTALVYVNWGRTIADCPWPGCGDAREVEIGQKTMTCCTTPPCPGHPSGLEWPPNMPAILAALAERTSDKRKNWFPDGHPLAAVGGFPAGQTPDDLRAETAVGEQRDAEAVASKRTALIEQLLKLGTEDEIISEIRETI